MKLKLHITKEDIMRHSYIHSMQCPITQALRRTGVDARSVTNTIRGGNFMLPVIELYPNNEHYTSQHPVAIANRRILGMQVKHGMFKLYAEEDKDKIVLESPDDINIEFDVPDNFIQQYS